MGYSICMPAWTIGPDAYDAIYGVVKRYGKTAAVIGGKTALSKAYDGIKAALEGKDFTISEPIWYGPNATYEAVDVLKANPVVKEADMLFAVGGGRAVDTVKCAAYQLDKPVFTFPTIASNCAGCTAIDIMYYEDDTFRDITYMDRCPEHTFLNSEIIANAPVEMMWAGIGDSLAKEFESDLASRGHKLFHTPILGLAAAKCCTGPFLEYSAKALEQVRNHEVGFEMEQVILDIVITAGIVSNMTIAHDGKEYFYNSSVAHATYYGSTVIPESGGKHLHGEIVSFGILVLLTYDNNFETREKIMTFNHSIGLPVTMADIGLKKEDLQAVADKASTVVEWDKVPGEPSKEKFIQAIIDTDIAGKEFLKSLE